MTGADPAATGRPAGVATLTEDQYRVLWALRQTVRNPRLEISLRKYQHFWGGLPEPWGETVWESMKSLTGLMCSHGRRPLQVQAPDSPECTGDELRILQMLDAALTGDGVTTRAHAEWLVRPVMADTLADVMAVLAHALSVGGVDMRSDA